MGALRLSRYSGIFDLYDFFEFFDLILPIATQNLNYTFSFSILRCAHPRSFRPFFGSYRIFIRSLFSDLNYWATQNLNYMVSFLILRCAHPRSRSGYSGVFDLYYFFWDLILPLHKTTCKFPHLIVSLSSPIAGHLWRRLAVLDFDLSKINRKL